MSWSWSNKTHDDFFSRLQRCRRVGSIVMWSATQLPAASLFCLLSLPFHLVCSLANLTGLANAMERSPPATCSGSRCSESAMTELARTCRPLTVLLEFFFTFVACDKVWHLSEGLVRSSGWLVWLADESSHLERSAGRAGLAASSYTAHKSFEQRRCPTADEALWLQRADIKHP